MLREAESTSKALYMSVRGYAVILAEELAPDDVCGLVPHSRQGDELVKAKAAEALSSLNDVLGLVAIKRD